MKRHTAVSLAATFTLLCCSILPVGAYDMGSPEEPLRLSAGLSHTVYVDETGTLWAWGSNQAGQLGTETQETSTDLEGNPNHALAQKYMPHGTCGVVSFGVKGGREAATKFMDGLEMASVVTHVADLRTCCLHPASTTHRQMSDEQLREAGVAPDLIRLSVGIENPDDILADIDQALEKATK